jgi:hypothetical protein
LLTEVLGVPYLSDEGMTSKRDLSAVDVSSLNTKLRLVVKEIVFEKHGTIREWTFVDGSTVHGSLDDVSAELREIAFSTLIRD